MEIYQTLNELTKIAYARPFFRIKQTRYFWGKQVKTIQMIFDVSV